LPSGASAGKNFDPAIDKEVEMAAITEARNDSKAEQLGYKLSVFIILLIASGLFFLGDHLYQVSRETGIISTAIPPIILLGLTLFFYRNKNLHRYWEVTFAFFCGTFGLFLAWAEVWPQRYADTFQGIAFLKFTEVLPVALAIILPTWFVQRSLAPIYLQKGNLKLGLGLGLGLSILIMTVYLLITWSKIDFEGLLQASGWIIIISILDAFFVLLMLPGLFLRRFIGLLGVVWGLILITMVYVLFNMGLRAAVGPIRDYGGLILFALLGFIYSFIMHKSDSIWGSLCLYTTVDLVYFIGMFASA
jgi:hypothetical protein